MASIVIIFGVLGFLLPFFQRDFNQPTVDSKIENLLEGFDDETDVTKISSLKILVSITRMFTWTFGAVPLFIDILILTPMRLLLLFLIYRSVRSGGR